MIIKKYEKIESTHIYLKENHKTYPSKTLIVANEQSSGIGTRGKKWFTGSKKNIAMSILYKPVCEVKDLNGLTLNIANALQKEIYDLCDVKLKIKEPNDLILNNKKICGILTESNSNGNKVNYIIISIGFNVNEIEFPDEIKNIATSLKMETGKEFDREKLIQRFSRVLENII